MPATIITYSGDKRIQLSNSQLIRRPIYWNSWNTIRIGIHFCIPSAASIPGGPRIFLGMCSGLTAGIGDATTTNFVGFMLNTVSLVRSAGPPAFSTANGFRFMKKVGTTFNFGAGDVSSLFTVSMAQANRAALIVQIAKGSPNYTGQFAFPNSGTPIGTDLTDAQMISLMEMTNMSDAATTVTNYSGGAFTNNTLAVDEVAGAFTALNVFWDRTSAPLEISAIYHRKVA